MRVRVAACTQRRGAGRREGARAPERPDRTVLPFLGGPLCAWSCGPREEALTCRKAAAFASCVADSACLSWSAAAMGALGSTCVSYTVVAYASDASTCGHSGTHRPRRQPRQPSGPARSCCCELPMRCAPWSPAASAPRAQPPPRGSPSGPGIPPAPSGRAEPGQAQRKGVSSSVYLRALQRQARTLSTLCSLVLAYRPLAVA